MVGSKMALDRRDIDYREYRVPSKIRITATIVTIMTTITQ